MWLEFLSTRSEEYTVSMVTEGIKWRVYIQRILNSLTRQNQFPEPKSLPLLHNPVQKRTNSCKNFNWPIEGLHSQKLQLQFTFNLRCPGSMQGRGFKFRKLLTCSKSTFSKLWLRLHDHDSILQRQYFMPSAQFWASIKFFATALTYIPVQDKSN